MMQEFRQQKKILKCCLFLGTISLLVFEINFEYGIEVLALLLFLKLFVQLLLKQYESYKFTKELKEEEEIAHKLSWGK